MRKSNYLAILLIISTVSPLTAFAYSISQDGIDLITEYEGIRYNLYDDPAGHCTIGVGHLVHTGNCDGTDPSEQEFLGGITEDQSQELLRADVATAEQDVNSQVTVPLTQSQFDALVSFTYNLGGGNLATLLSDSGLNNGAYGAVPAELNRYTHGRVNGVMQELPGLVTRRANEAELFKEGTSEICTIIGEWTVHYQWPSEDIGDCLIFFHDDGTFTISYDSKPTEETDGLDSGKWTQNGNAIRWQHDHSPSATYEGTMESSSSMSGTMTDDDSDAQGEWSADKRYYQYTA
jgi:GH24 family phage-related lysozyme (muramidase)